jgi:hemerythrin-like domain-containing protein
MIRPFWHGCFQRAVIPPEQNDRAGVYPPANGRDRNPGNYDMKAIEDLKSEHEVIIRALDILDALSQRADGGLFEALLDIDILLESMQKFTDQWHQVKEEDALFPALRKAGLSRENGPVGVMFQEHRLGSLYFKGAKEALRDTSRAFVGAAFVEFRIHAARYTGLLRKHIGKENTMLFPLVEQMFTENRLAVLQDTFEMVEKRKGGKQQANKYRKLLDALSEKYGKLRDSTQIVTS